MPQISPISWLLVLSLSITLFLIVTSNSSLSQINYINPNPLNNIQNQNNW